MKKKIAVCMILTSLLAQPMLNAAEGNNPSGVVRAFNYAGSVISGAISKGIDVSLLGIGVGSWSIAALLYSCGQEIKNQNWADRIVSNCPHLSWEDKITINAYTIGFTAVGAAAFGTLALKKCSWERPRVQA